MSRVGNYVSLDMFWSTTHEKCWVKELKEKYFVVDITIDVAILLYAKNETIPFQEVTCSNKNWWDLNVTSVFERAARYYIEFHYGKTSL